MMDHKTQRPQTPRLIFVNRFFFPDTSATAQMLSAVAFHLATTGHRVHVIASRSRHRDQIPLPAQQNVAGVSISRINIPSFDRYGLAGRALQYASFHIGATIKIARIARKNDVIVAKSDPPLICIPISWISTLRQTKMINWLQDLYPETAFALKLGSANSVTGRILLAMRNAALKHADTCICIGERMVDKLNAIGIQRPAIHVIPNFCDDRSIQPIDFGHSTLRTQCQIDRNTFVVGYSGNLGRAHDLQTMLDAATLLRQRSDIVFMFTGGGHLRTTLQHRREQLGLNSIVCLPYQPTEKLSDMLGAADVHWLSLLPELEGCIVPSKLYAAAAAGRGVITIGDTNGETARIVRNHHFGYAIAIGDSHNLANHIALLADNRKQCAALGAAARKYIDSHASQHHALNKWDQLLASVEQTTR